MTTKPFSIPEAPTDEEIQHMCDLYTEDEQTFVCGANFLRTQMLPHREASVRMYEALNWIIKCAEILRGNELSDQSYLQLFNETKKYERVAKETLADVEKIYNGKS